MIFKLGMENEFYCVRHRFHLTIMMKLEFNVSFIKLVSLCISFPWIPPIVNGRVSSFHKESKGLRQGFPFPSFVYIIMVDALSRRLEHETRIVILMGIRYVRGVINIKCSQFVGDTLLLNGASTIISKRFKVVMDNFLLTLRRKMNSKDSQIDFWNTFSVKPRHICVI